MLLVIAALAGCAAPPPPMWKGDFHPINPMPASTASGAKAQ